ncbi:MAG TPA: hypothetical protein VM142_10560 [Acidimicrobiales bacterium]|nr:hypothetical protein [Acidimicrobiales bacterium]
MITPIRDGAEPPGEVSVEALGRDAEGLDHDQPPSVSWLPLAGLAVGLWSLVPPYAGPAINTRFKVEIADHVVPGVVVLALSVAALLAARQRRRPTLMLTLGLVVFLAGFWMTATHVPLLDEGARGDAGLAAVVHHSAPGLAVALLGLYWAAIFWHETAPEPDQPESPEDEIDGDNEPEHC